jgi:hypothetical protein
MQVRAHNQVGQMIMSRNNIAANTNSQALTVPAAAQVAAK